MPCWALPKQTIAKKNLANNVPIRIERKPLQVHALAALGGFGVVAPLPSTSLDLTNYKGSRKRAPERPSEWKGLRTASAARHVSTQLARIPKIWPSRFTKSKWLFKRANGDLFFTSLKTLLYS